jgi:hypothetical protein
MLQGKLINYWSVNAAGEVDQLPICQCCRGRFSTTDLSLLQGKVISYYSERAGVSIKTFLTEEMVTVSSLLLRRTSNYIFNWFFYHLYPWLLWREREQTKFKRNCKKDIATVPWVIIVNLFKIAVWRVYAETALSTSGKMYPIPT